MVSKYPHSSTISWLSAGTTNSVGVWTPGTLNTLVVTKCDIQPKSGTIAAGEGGKVLQYNWTVYSERITGDTGVPEDAKLTFFSSNHVMVQLFRHQKHLEIKCQD